MMEIEVWADEDELIEANAEACCAVVRAGLYATAQPISADELRDPLALTTMLARRLACRALRVED